MYTLKISCLNYIVVFATACCASIASAQSDPANFSTVINSPPTVIGSSDSIGSDTQLNVFNGGSVGTFFDAGGFSGSSTNIEVNVAGGSLSSFFNAYAGSKVNISGGTVGSFFDSNDNSVVNISGGTVGTSFGAHDDSVVNISGGIVGSFFDSNESSVVNISGGTVGSNFDANDSSVVNISGGKVGRHFNAEAGSTVNVSGGLIDRDFEASSGSQLAFVGGEFLVNNAAVANPAAVTLADTDILSGTLEDGTVIIFSDLNDYYLDTTFSLVSATLPTADTTPMTVTESTGVVPSGLRPGQSLTVVGPVSLREGFSSVGATLDVHGGIAEDRMIVSDSTLNLTTGEIGGYLMAHHGSTINLAGGEIGWFATIDSGSELTISDGSIGSRLTAGEGSTVNLEGGSVGTSFSALSGSEVNISGGSTDFFFRAKSGSTVNMTGGHLGGYSDAEAGSVVNISGGSLGSRFDALSGSGVNLTGGDFLLNGATPLDLNSVTLSGADVLTGVLQDGSVFVFSGEAGDRINGISLLAGTVPVVDTTPIIVETESDVAPAGLRVGQTLTVRGSGKVGSEFRAVDAALNVQGGSVGSNVKAVGTEVNISGGRVGSGFEALTESSINVSGGEIDRDFDAHAGSVVELSGGVTGTGFRARVGSDVTLVGGDFLLNGQAVSPQSSVTLAETDILTGALQDGSTFIFAPESRDELNNVKLQVVALPSADPTPIIVNSPSSAKPNGLRAGQTLTVNNTGSLPDFFTAVGATLNVDTSFGRRVGRGLEVMDSTVNMSGGTISSDFNVHGQSTVNITGGSVEEIIAFNGSTVNLAGGALGDFFGYTSIANSGSVINISDGSVGSLTARENSEVNISGGSFGSFFQESVLVAEANSTFNISGGTFGDESSLLAYAGSNINLSGAQFFVDGVAVEIAAGDSLLISDRNAEFRGRFADGSVFHFGLGTDDPASFFGSSGQDFFAADALLSITATRPGDFNADGVVDVKDVDFYSGNIGREVVDDIFGTGFEGDNGMVLLDLDGDGFVTLDDHDFLIESLIDTSLGNGSLVGDLNLDGDVDVSELVATNPGFRNVGDASAMLAHLGTTAGALYSQGDLNADGDVDVSQIVFIGGQVVNVGDASRLLANLGQTQSSAMTVSSAAVPEPSSFGMLVAALVATATGRRKRCSP